MPVSHAANSDTFTLSTPSDREITITRLFDASPALVFEAMTRPEHVRRWWGNLDDRYSVTVDAPGRLVYTEIFEPFPDVESVVTQILTGEGSKTRLTVTSSYPSLEVRDMVLKTGMEKGAALSYDRLDDVAQELARIVAQ